MMSQKYSPEMRERALRMLDEARASGEYRNLMTAVRHVMLRLIDSIGSAFPPAWSRSPSPAEP
jgi:hypothetical protein